MTDPFASVAVHYDIMIDWPTRIARERPFFTGLFSEGTVRRVLDVGCGTGHHARLFAELGAETVGIDPSEAMLQRARALTPGDNPTFIAGGFTEIPQLAGTFDLVTVLGNTLAYAQHRTELTRILRNIRRVLTPGGRVCLQVVNYDAILLADERWLPLVTRNVDGREYLFLREHRRQRRRVEFTITTLVKNATWTRTTERSLQFPVTGETLTHALQHAGFARIALYGDYQYTPFDPASSPGLVALAEKAS
jgi:SAM-dependent methyltransferase